VAREKAGIIKHRVPVVTAAEGVPLEVIRDRCANLGAPLYVVGKDITFRGEALDLAAQRITVHSRGKTYADLILPLLGVHQRANAACAVAAADLLREKGYRTTGEAIARGLAGVWWPGRFEVVRRTPLTILDGAHNPAGAAALAEAARQHLGGRKLVLVLGILDDKDRESMVQRLAPLAEEIIVTRPPGARAANWRGVAAAARRYRRAVWEVEDPRSAVKEAFKRAGSGGAVLVTGSLYLVGAVRALFPAGERNGAPWEDSRPGACPPRQPARRG
jgi:dihydrofolate synthase/folylpolyglutamate synthase